MPNLKMQEQLQVRLRLLVFYLLHNKQAHQFGFVMLFLTVMGLAYYVGHAVEKKAYHDLSVSIASVVVEKLGVEVHYKDSPHAHVAMIDHEVDMLDKKIEQLKRSEIENVLKQKELQEQLYFYKSVLAPEELQKGIFIFSIHVSKPMQKDNHYPIEIILRKGNKKGLVGSGHVEVIVYGEFHKGAEREKGTIDLKEINFSFKYFQRWAGEIEIPPNFTPESLKTIIVSSRSKPVIQEYSWKEVASKLLLSGN